MSSLRRLELFVFLACWFAFAYFNQGGGWNQNSRFAEIRAMAEQGRFAIDDFFLYNRATTADGTPSPELTRIPVDHGQFTRDGQRYHICWVSGNWDLTPVGDQPVPEDVKKVAMIPETVDQPWSCASGDVAYVDKTGHFHPNKPPGTSFLGLPAYWIILHVEKLLGINPDHWWTLTVNAWLTTVFSVGLLSAFGCVMLLRLALKFSDGRLVPAVLATLGFAFGTTFFPFATILFDHALTASLLITAFYCLSWDRCGGFGTCALNYTSGDVRNLIAGLCAGLAVVTNYVAGGAVLALGLYALLAGPGWHWRRAIAFSLGGLPMALLLGYYHHVNFGSATALANDFQNPLFKDASGSLGMFGSPNPYVVGLLLVSPYRGIFFLAPVLILGLIGWIVWLREKTWAPEARLGIAIFGFFFFINTTFNGYHAGFSAGPRYLVPGIPFLALATVVAFSRWRLVSAIFLAVSIFQNFLLTATDGQNPLAVGGHARIDDQHRKDDFWCNLVTEYAAPLFFTGKVGPLLAQMADIKAEAEADRLENQEPDELVRAQKLAAYKAELAAGIERGDRDPFLLAAIRGPVSVNPVAVYDGLLGYSLYRIEEAPCQWASFNLGEFLAPRSRWSVLPLFLVSGGLLFAAYRLARREDETATT